MSGEGEESSGGGDTSTIQSRIKMDEELYNNEYLHLQASDHPGLQIITIKFNGNNFQRWGRAIKIALKTKVKLGFITGQCTRPTQASLSNQWDKCDNMMISWLLNCMISDLSESFLY